MQPSFILENRVHNLGGLLWIALGGHIRKLEPVDINDFPTCYKNIERRESVWRLGQRSSCLFLHTFDQFPVKDHTLALSQSQEIKVHISLYLLESEKKVGKLPNPTLHFAI